MKMKLIVFLVLVGSVLVSSAAHAQARQFSSVCTRNAEKLDRKLAESFKDKNPSFYGTREYREYILLTPQILEPCAGTDKTAQSRVERAHSGLRDYDDFCSKPNIKCEPIVEATSLNFAGRPTKEYSPAQVELVYRFLSFIRNELTSMQSDPNYSADIGEIRGESLPFGPRAGVPAPPATDASDPQCPDNNLEAANQEIAKIEETLAGYNQQVAEHSTAVTPRLQIVMWGTSKEAAVIRQYCHSPSFMDRLASLNASYESALKACRQINRSPDTECVPMLPGASAFESSGMPGTPLLTGDSSSKPDSAITVAEGSGQSKPATAGKQSISDGRTSPSSSQPAAARQQKQHGPQNASSCIKEKDSRFVNTCDYDVEVSFCVENPRQTGNLFDSSKAFACPNGGLSTVPAGKVEPNVLHGDLQWFACAEVDIATMRTQYKKGSGYGGSCY